MNRRILRSISPKQVALLVGLPDPAEFAAACAACIPSPANACASTPAAHAARRGINYSLTLTFIERRVDLSGTKAMYEVGT
jgi:hypothetical protein